MPHCGFIYQHLAPTEALPKMSSLVCMANRHRQGDRPTNPASLNVHIQQEAIPEHFLLTELQVGQRRHFIFYAATLLSLLRCAKEWYVYGTFKAVGSSFYSSVDNPCIPQKRWLWQASTSCLCPDVRKCYRWIFHCSAPPTKPSPICQ